MWCNDGHLIVTIHKKKQKNTKKIMKIWIDIKNKK